MRINGTAVRHYLITRKKSISNYCRNAKSSDVGDNDGPGSSEEDQKPPGSRFADAALKMVALAIVIALIVGLVVVETSASQNITKDSYFYGQSPAVYPSPNATGTGSWAAAYSRAAKMVDRMTLEEKNSLTSGTLSAHNGCSGAIRSVDRLGFPGLCLSDAGNGLRSADFVNAYPAGLHVGASWNKHLAHHRAIEMGLEFRRKGVNVALGPVVGPLGRVVTGGRNWEGFSNDPYLAGRMAAETVRGMQGVGVTTSTKHYIGNEQELWRNPGTSHGHTIESVSSNIDDKTMHELYLWPFQDAVRAGSGCVMCSYQRINNSYGCQNSKTLNGLLKEELGFQGFVVTDWGAQHAGYVGAKAGLDMVMPYSVTWGKKLLTAVNNGSLPEYRLNDMVTRILAAWYKMGQDSVEFEIPGHGIPAVLSKPHKAVDAKSQSSKPILLQGAIEGHVLVKNTNNFLPLKKPKLLSLFGYDARALKSLDLTGILNPPPQSSQYANFNLWVGGGSGANSPAFISDPSSAFSQKAYYDDTSVLWDFESQNPDVNGASDVCIVFINAFASEGYDRPGIEDDYSDKLVQNVAKQCNNTVVVIHNAGIRTVGDWIDNENVKAVVFGHLPGQDSGRALVKLMYGAESFSGKLPYTVAKRAEQYGQLLYHDKPEGKYIFFPQSDFTEGIYTDYRDFDERGLEPKFEFGFGMSYTTFEFSTITLTPNSTAYSSIYPAEAAIEQGGNPRLFDTVATITCVVSNTGSYDAQEVAQLYVGIPHGPRKQLRGFEKIMLVQGESKQVTFELTRRDLSAWDTHAQKWKLQSGNYMIYVGNSISRLPLRGTMSIVR